MQWLFWGKRTRINNSRVLEIISGNKYYSNPNIMEEQEKKLLLEIDKIYTELLEEPYD